MSESVTLSLQSFATGISQPSQAAVTIPKGKYNIYALGLLQNKNDNNIESNFTLYLNINNDNPSFTSMPNRSWTNGVPTLSGNSDLMLHGTSDVFFTSDSNTISAKADITGLPLGSNYTTQLLLLVSKSAIAPA